MSNRTSPRLLPKEALIKTGLVDHVNWVFQPVLGWILRLRYRLILLLMPHQRVHRLLEVGYGSGILMPELAARCNELHGIDIHPMYQQVTDRLREFHIVAHLVSGSAESMLFSNAFFDCIVAVSSLEFIEDFESACQELRRVLKPGGILVLVTPGHSPFVDLGLKLLTGESAQKDYGDRRHQLMSTLLKYFTVQEKRVFPPIFGSFFCLYTALKVSPC